ncbi:MAG: 16S rRNA (cytosine(967)-C(5))-methyltransferase RsmB [Burkholderiales bacterium]|nr:16S rRNA (cytosine(967)-C(5))-methyltransferase RsmB [Burkholderiales bacterium]
MSDTPGKPPRKILTRPVVDQSNIKSSRPAPAQHKQGAAPRAKSIAAPVADLIAIKGDSLAFSLQGAALALSYVLDGTALPQALSRVFLQTDASPQARGAIQDIAYRTMRQVGRADAIIKLMTTKLPEPTVLYSLLCCALTLLMTEENEDAPYDDFVLVDQAVNAAAASPDMVFAKGMINAVLRRFLREKKELLTQAMKQVVAVWNYPQWWVDQCKAAYPQDWQAILKTGNTPPPMTLRVNQTQTTVAAYLETLSQAGISAQQIGPYAVRLDKALPVQQVPGFAQGMVSVQDAGAQLAAQLLDLKDGMSVLDACAAPGGKTGHILETAKVELVALDTDAKRLDRIHENLARLHLFATIKQGDAARQQWWHGQNFDRILADVPCTASGVVRRHPDIRWLRRKTDATQLAETSAKILDNLWQMLKPGGKLLLVTCSIWPVESELQAVAFAQRNSAIRLDAPGQLFPTSEINNEHDGLFYALFQKS